MAYPYPTDPAYDILYAPYPYVNNQTPSMVNVDAITAYYPEFEAEFYPRCYTTGQLYSPAPVDPILQAEFNRPGRLDNPILFSSPGILAYSHRPLITQPGGRDIRRGRLSRLTRRYM